MIVAPAPRSAAAQRKEQQRRTADGHPVQSFQCLLKDLATQCKNTVRWESAPDVTLNESPCQPISTVASLNFWACR